MCCGGADCWCGGLSGREGCCEGVCWRVSSGLRWAVYCDDVYHEESGSSVCLHSG